MIAVSLAHSAAQICSLPFTHGAEPMKRTSLSHPLQIAEIAVSAGTIGLTFCPGKAGDSLYGSPWARDLDLDIERLAAWGASKVVTLMEASEFALLGVPDLGHKIQAAGLDWVHLPIRDVSVPDAAFIDTWANLTKALQRSLLRGDKIVFHCRGGLGRTGLVASLLLLDLGWDAETAITTVRSVRPGAIETMEQENYVRRYLPYLSHASLLGGAIGDSLGADIEFLSLGEIRARFPQGVDQLAQTAAVAPGWFTDDTQMTLFSAEGIIRAHIRMMLKGICNLPGVVQHALLRWLVTQGGKPKPDLDPLVGLVHERMLHHRAAPGVTCLSALESAPNFGEPAHNDSKGCGTIMRIAPIAFGIARERVREAAIATSACTHGHPVGQLAAAAWAEILADVQAGMELQEAAERTAGAYSDLGQPGVIVARSIQGALCAAPDGRAETVESLGAGWVAEEALAIALYASMAAKNFEDGLRIAVTHSGDSDSTGAIAGNMLGLLYPDQIFRHRWAKEVGGRDLIARIALDLPLSPYWASEADNQFERYPGW